MSELTTDVLIAVIGVGLAFSVPRIRRIVVEVFRHPLRKSKIETHGPAGAH